MGDQFIRFLGKALVPCVVFLVLALARRYMSASSLKSPDGEKYSLGELDDRFAAAKWFVGIGMVVIGLLFAIGTQSALVWLNRYMATADGAAEFRIWPESAIWWFLPGLGALTLCWEMTLELWSIFGTREEARLYSYWSNMKAGFDATKLLRWMAILIALPIGIFTLLELPVHAALRQSDIRECGYAFAGCKTYRYADARRMTIIDGFRTRDGKLTRRAGIVIDFNDGRRWFSASIGEFSERIDPVLEELLEKKTGLSYEHAQAEADIPPLDSSRGRQ